ISFLSWKVGANARDSRNSSQAVGFGIESIFRLCLNQINVKPALRRPARAQCASVHRGSLRCIGDRKSEIGNRESEGRQSASSRPSDDKRRLLAPDLRSRMLLWPLALAALRALSAHDDLILADIEAFEA